MQGALRRMERLAETVPECVTERLALLRSLVEVTNIANTNMNRWIVENNTVRADSEFRKIAIGLSEARTMLAEAERCASGGEKVDDSSIIEFTYDGVTSDGDETMEEDSFEFDVGMDPPQSSPYT
jgi:hypothetical protein